MAGSQGVASHVGTEMDEEITDVFGQSFDSALVPTREQVRDCRLHL